MAFTENYLSKPDVALNGMVADLSPATIISRTVETAALGFGLPVVQGTGDHEARLAASGDTEILGISVLSKAVEANSVDQYPVDDTASIMVQGTIWVIAAAAVVAGDPVRVTVDGATFVTTAGAGVVDVVGAKYETSGGIGDLVRVRIV